MFYKDRMTARLAMLHARDADDNVPAGGGTTGSGAEGNPPAPDAKTEGNPGPNTGSSATGASGSGGTNGAPKTFGEEDVERIVKDRLKRDREAREAEAAEAKRLEGLKAEERLAEEKKKIQDERDAAVQRAVNAERALELTGKVVDPTAAIRLLDPERHLDAKGRVDVDKLLKEFPFLAPTNAAPAPSGPGAGGTQSRNPDTSRPLSSWAAAEAADKTRR